MFLLAMGASPISQLPPVVWLIPVGLLVLKMLAVRVLRGRDEYRIWWAGIVRLLAFWGMWLVGIVTSVGCIYGGHYMGQLLGLPAGKYATIIGLFVNLLIVGGPAAFIMSLLGRLDRRALAILEAQ